MPRKPIIRSQKHFYHLTSKSFYQEGFFLPVGDMWEIMNRKMKPLQTEHDLEISFFLVLQSRFHLILRSPKLDIDRVMFHLMMNTTRTVQKRTGRINRIFGSRYHGCLITNDKDLENILRYLNWLPVMHGHVKNLSDYPYMNGGQTVSPFNQENRKLIEAGLKKTIFKYPKNSSNRLMFPI